MLLTAVAQCSQLRLGIDTAVFGRMRDICHLRDDGVLVLVVQHNLLDRLRRQLAVLGRRGKDAMSVHFDGTGFMDIDMPGAR